MPKVVVTTDDNETVYEIDIAAADLRTPIARANFFLDLNAALKIAAKLPAIVEKLKNANTT